MTKMKFTPLLTGKLKPPKLRQVLARPRLLESKLPGERYKLVIICAGAGYGKTTLMAQMADALPGQSLWYQIDSLDKDPAVFLRHLIEGVSLVLEGVGSRSLERLSEAKDFNVEGESVLAILASEISESASEPLTFFFDDYHLFDNVDLFAKLIDSFITRLPERAAVVLASRTKPKLPIARLRSQGLVGEIHEQDLCFSLAETKDLLLNIWGLELEADTLSHLYKKTEGWAAGLVLMEDQLKSGSNLPELFSQQKTVRGHVYEYLAEEVLSRQLPELRDLLIQCSLIDPVDPAICRAALAIEDTGELLGLAEQLNLFTTSIGDTGLFRFHPLFREYLQVRLAERGEEGVRELHGRYGRAYEEAGDKRKAVDHFLAGEFYQDAIRNIVDINQSMLDEGQYVTLAGWLNELKGQELPPELLICQSEVELASGNFQQALQKVKAAEKLLRPQDIKQHCRCAITMSECLTEVGKNKEGLKILKRLLKLKMDPEMRAEVLRSIARCYFQEFDSEGFSLCRRQLAKLSVNLSTTYISWKLNELLANECCWKGEFKKGFNILKDLVNTSGISLRKKILHMNNLAWCLMMLGDYHEAAKVAKICVDFAKKNNERKVIPAFFDTYGLVLIVLGDYESGIAILKDAIKTIELLKQSNIDIKVAYCHLGTAARRQGNLKQALMYHKKSNDMARSTRDKRVLPMAQVNIGSDLVRLNQAEDASPFFKEARRLALKYSFGHILTQLDFHQAWAAYLAGDKKAEIEALRSAFSRARKFQHNHFLIQEGKISLPLFTSVLANGIEVEYASWILEQIGPASITALQPLLNHSHAHVRANAAALMGRIGNTSGIALLRRVINDKDPQVRQKARLSLKTLREKLEAPIELLTKRECQVLEMVAAGASNAKIAKELYISEVTVKTHINRIFKKLGLTNRLEAALFFKKELNKSSSKIT